MGHQDRGDYDNLGLSVRSQPDHGRPPRHIPPATTAVPSDTFDSTQRGDSTRPNDEEFGESLAQTWRPVGRAAQRARAALADWPEARFFWLPHAGSGSASVIRAFAPCLDHPRPLIAGAAARLLAAGLPAREARHAEPMPGSVDSLVDQLDTAAGPTIGPEIWMGHSWGALLATLCVYRRLGGDCGVRDRTAGPVGLVVLNAPVPNGDAAARQPVRRSSQMSDEAFLEWIDQRYGGVPAAIRQDASLAALFLPALRGDFGLYESFRIPNLPPLPLPIIAVGSTDDPAVDAAALQAWRSRSSEVFRTRVLQGDHFAPLQHPVAVLRLATLLLPTAPAPRVPAPRVPISGQSRP